MKKAEAAAKAVRVITVPPLVVIAFVGILSVLTDGTVFCPADTAVTILLLGIVPALAYPLQRFVPAFRDQGRHGQRRFAFVMSLLGYTLAVFCGLLSHASRPLLLIDLTYLISVILLKLCNLLLTIRPSGHLCSITGPMSLLVHFLGWNVILPCFVLLLLVGWSSVYLHRHTIAETISGSCVGILGYLLAALFTLS